MRTIMTTKSRHFVTCTVAIMVLVFASISTVAAQETKYYDDITQKMFDNCIKNHESPEGWSEYKGGNSGEMMVFGWKMPTHNHWVATFRYEFDPSQRRLTYRGDPKLVYHLVWPGGGWKTLWEGFDKTMRECQRRG